MNSIAHRTAILERLDGDVSLLAEVVTLFLEDGPQLVERIRQALAAGDALGLARAAHTLKGSVGNFCAPAAVEAAAELEELGRDGNWAAVPAAFRRLEAVMERLQAELVHLASLSVPA